MVCRIGKIFVTVTGKHSRTFRPSVFVRVVDFVISGRIDDYFRLSVLFDKVDLEPANAIGIHVFGGQKIQFPVGGKMERPVDTHSEVFGNFGIRTLRLIRAEEVMPFASARLAHIEPAFVVNHLGRERYVRFRSCVVLSGRRICPAFPLPVDEVFGRPARNFSGCLLVSVERSIKVIPAVKPEHERIADVVNVAVAVVKLDVVVVIAVIVRVYRIGDFVSVGGRARCGIVRRHRLFAAPEHRRRARYETERGRRDFRKFVYLHSFLRNELSCR